jgi:hypothetical protein
MAKDKEPKESAFEKNLRDSYLQSVVGFNLLNGKNNPLGQSGERAGEIAEYNFLRDEKTHKTRDELYQSELKYAKENGISAKPERPSDYKVIKYSKQIVEESKQKVTLKGLAKIAKDSGAKIDFEIPQGIEKMTLEKIMPFLQEVEGDTDKLSKENKAFIEMYKLLSQSYDMAIAQKITGNTYWEGINTQGKKVVEEYSPKKKE